MADKFFQDKQEEPKKEESKPEEPKPVKVGDKEFSPDQLQELVKRGELTKELEDKWNTKVDQLYPEFTRATQKKKELQQEVEELQKKLKTPANPQQTQITDEQKAQAIRQAEEIGIITKNNANQLVEGLVDKKVQEILSLRDLFADTNKAIKQAKDKWGIEVDAQTLIEHMQKPESPKVPIKAIRDMFEEQIDKQKEQEFAKKKQSSYQTQSVSSFKKEPIPPEFKDNKKVRDMVRESLLGEK